jgi:hypothetical protein
MPAVDQLLDSTSTGGRTSTLSALFSSHALSLDYRANRFDLAVLMSVFGCVTNSLTGA